MTDGHRASARAFCDAAITRGQPLEWFEELYSAANGDPAIIPWADLEPNPNFIAWHRASRHDFLGQRCLKVGCGLGRRSRGLHWALQMNRRISNKEPQNLEGRRARTRAKDQLDSKHSHFVIRHSLFGILRFSSRIVFHGGAGNRHGGTSLLR
jgi:hypothetical protein